MILNAGVEGVREFPGAELVGTVYNALRSAASASGSTWDEWHQLDENQQYALAQAVYFGTALVESADGAKWVDLAAQLCSRYHEFALPAVQWGDKTPGEKAAWEAATRHLANCMDMDEEEADLAPHEQRWREWASAKLQQNSNMWARNE